MKTTRPLEFYLHAWDVFQNDTRDVFKYTKALDAFVSAGEKFNVPLSGCMTNKKTCVSYMLDDVERKVFMKKTKR